MSEGEEHADGHLAVTREDLVAADAEDDHVSDAGGQAQIRLEKALK